MESNLKRNSNADIFIYSHIPFRPIVTDHVYKVLTNSHSDSSLFNTDLEIFRDYDGINISDKNLMYNEYSGFYWIWKNYPIKDYVGLNHYRRMYTTDKNTLMQFDDMPTFDEIFEDYEIILNKPINLIGHKGLDIEGKTLSNYDWYEYWHCIDDLHLLKEILNDKFPEYIDGYEKMCKATYLYPSNMFVMEKDMFNEYCDFSFTILSEFRKRRGFFTKDDCVKYVEEHKDSYVKNKPGHSYYDVEKQSRIIGYIAERVLATYLMHEDENGESIEDHAKIFNWLMIPEYLYKV